MCTRTTPPPGRLAPRGRLAPPPLTSVLGPPAFFRKRPKKGTSVDFPEFFSCSGSEKQWETPFPALFGTFSHPPAAQRPKIFGILPSTWYRKYGPYFCPWPPLKLAPRPYFCPQPGPSARGGGGGIYTHANIYRHVRSGVSYKTSGPNVDIFSAPAALTAPLHVVYMTALLE